MDGLALCAGIGGLELGLKLACPSLRTVAYVEREAYAAVVLAARMEEGCLDKAPIWSDVTTFDGLPWRGLVDIVSSGFPCQPFSLAGKLKREKDPRHLWPEIARIIGECEPELVFLENVHISAFRQPFDDLRAMGFTLSPPYACTAAELGAGHLRRRVFVLAYSEERMPRPARRGKGTSDAQKSILAHRNSKPSDMRTEQRKEIQNATGDVAIPADTASFQCNRKASGADGSRAEAEISSDAPSPRLQGFGRIKNQEQTERRDRIIETTWWASEPRLERLVHGVPNRVDRDRTLGNAVVPIVAAKAFVELVRRIER